MAVIVEVADEGRVPSTNVMTPVQWAGTIHLAATTQRELQPGEREPVLVDATPRAADDGEE